MSAVNLEGTARPEQMTEFSETYQPADEARKEGRQKRKIMTDALIIALHREAAGADGKPTKKLNAIADKLVDRAIDGDVAAIKEVFDRSDGKVPMPVGGTDELPPLTGLTVTFVKPD